jgi:hypothetical protein
MTDTFPPDTRLVQRHRPGAWIGAIRRAIGPGAEAVERNVFETRPPYYLIALWKPLRFDQPALPRWPRKAMLVAPDKAAAIAELLRDIPRSDVLWLTGQDIDWCLIADIVLLSESRLPAQQRRGLEQFVNDERDATLAAIHDNYCDSEVGSLRSRPGLLGGRG